jgi:hypothetical protein
VRVVQARHGSIAVDTPDDLERVRRVITAEAIQ